MKAHEQVITLVAIMKIIAPPFEPVINGFAAGEKNHFQIIGHAEPRNETMDAHALTEEAPCIAAGGIQTVYVTIKNADCHLHEKRGAPPLNFYSGVFKKLQAADAEANQRAIKKY